MVMGKISSWAVRRKKEYLVAGGATFFVTAVLGKARCSAFARPAQLTVQACLFHRLPAGCIFGLGLGDLGHLAGVIGAFGIRYVAEERERGREMCVPDCRSQIAVGLRSSGDYGVMQHAAPRFGKCWSPSKRAA